MMFCMIVIFILFGLIVEKMKFIFYLLFVVIWIVFVYSLVVYWVWGGGWINKFGVLDFVGGMVVYIILGVFGLVLVIMIGKGNKYFELILYNFIIMLIGGIFVWIGWYGFNVGSVFIFDNIVMFVFINIVILVSVGVIGWLILEYIFKKMISLFGFLFGVLVGLVVIIFVVGYVIYFSVIIMVLIGGICCYIVINYIKVKLKYYDVLDVFGIYGVGGIIGVVLIVVF